MQIIINPNCEDADELRQKIKDNDGYCLCALKKNDDTKCMCKEFREKDTSGDCGCGLYRKIESNELQEWSVPLSQLRSFINKLKGQDGNTKIPFSLICSVYYPDSWKRMQDALAAEYIKGYNEGREEKN